MASSHLVLTPAPQGGRPWRCSGLWRVTDLEPAGEGGVPQGLDSSPRDRKPKLAVRPARPQNCSQVLLRLQEAPSFHADSPRLWGPPPSVPPDNLLCVCSGHGRDGGAVWELAGSLPPGTRSSQGFLSAPTCLLVCLNTRADWPGPAPRQTRKQVRGGLGFYRFYSDRARR